MDCSDVFCEHRCLRLGWCFHWPYSFESHAEHYDHLHIRVFPVSILRTGKLAGPSFPLDSNAAFHVSQVGFAFVDLLVEVKGHTKTIVGPAIVYWRSRSYPLRMNPDATCSSAIHEMDHTSKKCVFKL